MDNLSQEELKESIDALNKFLNTCKSSSQSIELRSLATEMSYKDYKIDNTSKAINYILSNIKIIGICGIKKLGYKDTTPNVYEYVFNYQDSGGNLGCLAFYKNPNSKDKIKWYIKSLHKDYQNIRESTTIPVHWLNEQEVKLISK